MEVKPGYKQTDVGVIPLDWEVSALRNCCSKITDGTHDTPKPVRAGIPFLTAIHIKDNRIDYGSCLYVTEADHAVIFSRCNPEKNDVLMVNIGAGVATTALVDVDYEFSLKNVALIKPDPRRTTGAYLNYSLAQRKPKITQDLSSGGAQPFLSLTQIGEIAIPLPPAQAEQEAIAEALSDADALTESLEQLIAKKRHLKQGAMQELLTGKRRLPGFSENWKVKPLGDLFDFSGGFTASRDQLSMEGHCYLHYGDIHTSSKNFIDVRSQRQDIPKLNVPLKRVGAASLLNDGDVVFVDASEDEEGSSKHVVIDNQYKIPFISGLHTIVAKEKTGELDHKYRRYCFQTTGIRAQFRFFAVGTKVLGINKTNIARVMLPIPSAPEQAAIAAILSDIDAEIAALESELSKARGIKQGMMQELLTGRIRLL
jgi:type I restriction enzyme S subunit